MKKLISVFIYLLLAVPCFAEIIIVDDDLPYDFNNIQAAVDYAGNGDFIFVFPGTYTGLGNRDVNFLGKSITVLSVNPDDPCVVAQTIIDCQGLGRAFSFASGEDANSVLAGFTITNGFADTGGAVFCDNSSPTITNCILSGNSAAMGGGMCNVYGGSPTVTNCTFSGNSATTNGGGMENYESSPTITSCTFNGNSAAMGGGMDNNYNGNESMSMC